MTDEMNETEEHREGDRSTSAKLATLWRKAHRKRKYTDTSDGCSREFGTKYAVVQMSP